MSSTDTAETHAHSPMEKEKPVQIHSVQLHGLQHTQDSLLAPLLQPILTSQTLSDLLARTQHACHQLDKLGIFKSIAVDLDYHSNNRQDEDEKEGVQVHLKVEERPRYTATANTGFRGHEGFMVCPLSLSSLTW